MNGAKEYVMQAYSALDKDEPQPIVESLVSEAIQYINDFNIHNSTSLFTFIAALNLLNAAIKKDEWKNKLQYHFIKDNVSKVADYFLANAGIFNDATIYYDKVSKCLYFKIFDIVFSFHYIIETKKILKIATQLEPIQWPGMRLQFIASSIFEYGLNMIETQQDKTVTDIQAKSLKVSQQRTLRPCPDCGKYISQSAKFCPNCGYDFGGAEDISKGIREGDRVVIETNGFRKTGRVQSKGNSFICLLLPKGSLYTIKYSAITSLTVIPRNKADLTKRDVENLLTTIFEEEGINENDNIITNSTIQDCSSILVSVVTDGGKSISCMAPIGFSKKITKNGDRLFCIDDMINRTCYQSLVEMQYKTLNSKFNKELTQVILNPNRSHLKIETILSYFQHTLVKDESKEALSLLRNKLDEILSGNVKDDADILVREKEETIPSDNNRIDSPSNLASTIEIQLPQPSTKLKKVEDAKSDAILTRNMPSMSESECRQVEKEVDTLIRVGKREECLSKSYEVIKTKRPTAKYFRSYLDRIVNTEIALDHTEQAIKYLCILIAFSESQSDTKPSNLSHLYISLARLLIKINNNDEATLALEWAEYLFPKNKKIVLNLRQTIGIGKKETGSELIKDSVISAEDVVVSRMLIQDVEQYAKTQADTDSEDSTPIELFNLAEIASKDKTKNNELRAQMYLDAATAYYKFNLATTSEFKLSVAHYARMKGDSLWSKIVESVQQYPDSLYHLIAECDSARSYYNEALGLYNDLEQKEYLQVILLKYLKIESLVSQIEGGKTPDPEWNKGSLKELIQDCLDDDNIESQKVLYRACISIGSSSERTWNTLSNDADGIGPLYGKLENSEYRTKTYQLINTIEGSSIDETFVPGKFFKKIFKHRHKQIKDLKTRIDDCLSWDFDPFDVSTFELKWKALDEYKELMFTTDRLALESISEVLTILQPYAGRKINERYRNLVSSQQVLIKSQLVVAETTTYYGRIFFFHLQEKWLKEIRHRIEEMGASALPKLQIFPEPCYIKKNDDGLGVIDFVVTNKGDSTADSFVVYATVAGKEYSITHNAALLAGDSCVESMVSADYSDMETADVLFKLVAKYQGKELPPFESEATYEVESGDVLTDEVQIPWIVSNTPKENIFKGREDNLTTLVNHYLSKDRTFTYVLYGLTRTGKSSILDYLCDRIEGKTLHEDSSKRIMTFRWNFLDISSRESSSKVSTIESLWKRLIEINIYNKLPEEIQDVIDSKYDERQLPRTLSQFDLDVVVEALNSVGVIPLITIDEFSNIKQMLKEDLVDASFLSDLRELALKGKACFVYAGTYDIKDLPKEKEFGIEGQMTNTRPMHINEIEQVYADELIDACDSIIFDEKAKSYIRALSGCVPYWIQWICLDCGKYAVAHKKRHLGYGDVDHVVKVLTGEELPSKSDTWEAIDEINFHNNQISPNNVAEHQLITCIAYLIRESSHIERGVSMDELSKLWDKYNVAQEKRLNMTRALKSLIEKRVVRQFTDETREVYRLNVDLFRRSWYVHHKDLNLEFSL